MRWCLLPVNASFFTRKALTALLVVLIISSVEGDTAGRGHPQQQPMYFITDFDGTIAHYDNIPPSDEVTTIVALPASSGSGKVAYISSTIVKKLETIKRITSSAGTAMICASGQRVTTMQQRQPFLPFFDYWISENGGRIHGNIAASSGDGVELSEIIEWTEFLEADKISKSALESFNEALEALALSDVKIDRKGYHSMIRIKAGNDSLEKIVDIIPSSLKYTSNLGYLDVQLRRSGKLQAVHWLLNRLEKRRNEDGYTGELPPFVFMGDDDNDVEIAAESAYALVAKPCSTAMYAFVQSVKYGQSPALKEADHLGIVGTVEILEHAIKKLNCQLDMDGKEDVGKKEEKTIRSKRKRGSMTSSSSRRYEKLAEFNPPASSLSVQQEEVDILTGSSPVNQSEPPPRTDVQTSDKSLLQTMIAYFKKPKWAICVILVTVIALLPV